jgi:hypothetical protein
MQTSVSNPILSRNTMCYSSVAGVILQVKVSAFERMLWRMFSRNVLVCVKPLEVPLEDPHSVSYHVKCEVLIGLK